MKRLLAMLVGILCWSAAAADPASGLGRLEKIGVDRGCRADVEADGVLVLRREISTDSQAVRSAARLLLKDPVDLSGKAVEFELRGDPEADRIQVSFNNRGSRIPVLRGDGGKGTLSATEWRRFRLEKGAADGLRFARRGVDGSDPDRVDQALFAMFHRTPRPGEVRLEMRNLRIVPARETSAGLPGGPDPFAELGGLKNVILAPGVTRSGTPDGTLSLRGNIVMQDRGTAEKKCSLRLKKPVDLTGKALQFDLRTPNGKLDTLYMWFFNAGKPKASWAFYSYASPVGKEWTRFVVQRQFSPRLNWHLTWGDDSPLNELDRIDITFGNFGARLGGEIGLDLRNFQIVDELPRLGTGLRRAVSLMLAVFICPFVA